MSAKKNSEVLLHFTTCAFFELLEKERQWFALLDTLRHLRWQRADPDECPEGQGVIIMLRNRGHWLRN